MMDKLWGDWYYDAAGKKWTTSDKGGTLEVRLATDEERSDEAYLSLRSS